MPVVVDIDEESLARYGQWPWPRYRVAQLLERVRDLGAAAVALDIVFAEPDRTSLPLIAREIERDLGVPVSIGEPAGRVADNDRRLAEVLGNRPLRPRLRLRLRLRFRQSRRTRASCTRSRPARRSAVPVAALVWPARRRSSATCRSSRGPPAPPGSSTWPPTWTAPCAACRCSSNTAGRCTRAWRSRRSFAPAVRPPSSSEPAARPTGFSGSPAGRSPSTATETCSCAFAAPGEDTPTSRLPPCSRGASPAGALAGRIAFVGTTAAGLKELRATPFDPIFPGPEVHAAALDTILQGDFLQRPRSAHGWELLAALLAGTLATLVLSRSGAVAAGLPLLIVGSATLWGGSFWLFSRAGLFVSPLIPQSVLAGTFALLSFLRFRQSEREAAEFSRKLSLTQDVIIQSMAALAETRDNETGGHIQRTRHYVKILAERLRDHPRFRDFLDDQTIELLYKLAPMHDIGKVGVRDRVLLKPERLTREEYEEMKRHTVYGDDTLELAERHLGDSSFLRIAREFALTHQERWDGSGYPHGLKGEQIPIAGRLMAVADVYDALVSRRIYKEPQTHEQAAAILAQGRGHPLRPGRDRRFSRRTRSSSWRSRRGSPIPPAAGQPPWSRRHTRASPDRRAEHGRAQFRPPGVHAPAFPELPRRYRVLIGPEAASGFASVLLQRLQAPVGRVPAIPPGESRRDQFAVQRSPVGQEDLGELPVVAVLPLAGETNGLPECEVGGMPLRPPPERLRQFRAIDAVEPDFDAEPAAHDHDAVAVPHADDPAFELGPRGPGCGLRFAPRPGRTGRRRRPNFARRRPLGAAGALPRICVSAPADDRGDASRGEQQASPVPEPHATGTSETVGTAGCRQGTAVRAGTPRREAPA